MQYFSILLWQKFPPPVLICSHQNKSCNQNTGKLFPNPFYHQTNTTKKNQSITVTPGQSETYLRIYYIFWHIEILFTFKWATFTDATKIVPAINKSKYFLLTYGNSTELSWSRHFCSVAEIVILIRVKIRYLKYLRYLTHSEIE